MKMFARWSLALVAAGLLNASASYAQDEEPPDLPPPDDSSDMGGGSAPSPAATATAPTNNPDTPGADTVPAGQELVNIDFPEPTEIKDIIRAVALWTGKNVILGKGVSGKVQMISPRKVTKEEAYQAFLSALNVLGLTTVETGKVIKIMPVQNAVKGNLQIYQGSSWAPRTDKMITQIVPLKYIDANQLQTTLSRIVTANSIIAYPPTNTLIISDTGYKVRRILAIIELLDVQGQQPQVAIVPIRYAEAKNIADRVREILDATKSAKGGAAPAGGRPGGYLNYRVSADERSNSVVIFGPPRTISDVKALVKKFDFPVEDQSSQAAIRVRFLDYADAKKLATTLSSLAQGGSNNRNTRNRAIASLPSFPGGPGMQTLPGGAGQASEAPVANLGENVKITADESSNSLLITGNKSAYDAINSIIRKLDQRQPQVYVEADILDIKIENGFKAETSIFGGYGKEKGQKTAIGWQGGKGVGPLIAATSNSNPGPTEVGQAVGALSKDFTVGILSGTTINVGGMKLTPGALINLAKTDGNTRVLSSPHLLTTNNEEAKIVVGSKLFYESSELSSIQGVGAVKKIEKEPVDLTFQLKPSISHTGDYVTMKINIDANEGSLNKDKLPDVNKRQTVQTLTVKNGQTAVISGLVRTSESDQYDKIPLLGDIPVLGWLFRNTTKQKVNSSLMIFITPHVVFGANDLAKIYDKKLKERDELLTYAYGSDFREDRFFSKIPNYEAGAAKGPDDAAPFRENEPSAGRGHSAAPSHAASPEEREEEELKRRSNTTVPAAPTAPAANGGATENMNTPAPVPGEGMDSGMDAGSGGMAPLPPPPPPPPVDGFDGNMGGGDMGGDIGSGDMGGGDFGNE